MRNDPVDNKVVGDFLASTRDKAGVTQVELARRLGKPQSFVSSYERGQRRIDFIEFAHIMRALGTDPQQVASDLVRLVVPLASRQ